MEENGLKNNVMTQQIILIRPTVDSRHLQAVLASRGYECIISPVMEIETLVTVVPEKLYDGLIVTSHNAFFATGRLEPLFLKPLFVVGEQTASIAHEIGFRQIIEGAGTAFDLVNEVLTYFPRRTEQLLYLRGRDVNFELGQTLNQERYKVDEYITYQSIPTDTLTPQAFHVITGDTPALIPFFSKNSALYFINLINKQDLKKYLQKHVAVCLSPGISNLLIESEWDKILTCKKPNRRSFIELLDLMVE